MRRGGRIRGRGLGDAGQLGGGQPAAVVRGDRTEPSVLRLPVGPGAGDLGVGAADEVPPHDELLLERLAPITSSRVPASPLPIGGLKQKVLAAHAAGLTDVILPERNRADLDDVPQDVRDAMTFHPVMTVAEVLEAALEPARDTVVA